MKTVMLPAASIQMTFRWPHEEVAEAACRGLYRALSWDVVLACVRCAEKNLHTHNLGRPSFLHQPAQRDSLLFSAAMIPVLFASNEVRDVQLEFSFCVCCFVIRFIYDLANIHF